MNRRQKWAFGLWLVAVGVSAQTDVWRSDSLQEVVVTGTGTQHLLKNAPVQTEVITAKMLRNYGGRSLQDILAGLTAGLLAQGMSPEDAAVSAVYIHSLAGKNAAVDLGKRSMLPSDLPSYFTDAFEEIGWDRTGDEI